LAGRFCLGRLNQEIELKSSTRERKVPA